MIYLSKHFIVMEIVLNIVGDGVGSAIDQVIETLYNHEDITYLTKLLAMGVLPNNFYR